MLEKELLKLGLTENEALIYNALLEKGRLTAQELVKQTCLKRGVAYFLIDQLAAKELIQKEKKKGSKTVFSISSPIFLKNLISKQLQEVQSRDSALGQLFPQLLELFEKQTHQPVVQFFNGIEGMKKVYLDTLTAPGEILAILQMGEIDPQILKWIRGVYIHKRVRAGIWAKVILAQDKKSHIYIEETPEKLREVVTVPKKQFPIKMEVNIYGNKVAFMSYHKDAPHFGVLIDSSYVADTLRALWSLAWIGARTASGKN